MIIEEIGEMVVPIFSMIWEKPQIFFFKSSDVSFFQI